MLNKGLLSNQVCDEIKKMIAQDQYSVGDKLPNETEISSLLGVSRITVREAIKILSALGIVEIRRGIGTFVCNRPGIGGDPLGLSFIEGDLFNDLYTMRLLIEPEAASLAAQNASAQDIAALDETLQYALTIYHDYQDGKMDKKTAALRYVDSEITFHAQVGISSKNEILSRITFIVCEAYMQRYWNADHFPQNLSFYNSHQTILKEIKLHNAQEAKKAMLVNIHMSKNFNGEEKKQ